MMTERGVAVDHSTIYRWVQRFAPEMEKRLRWQWRWPRSSSWRVDGLHQGLRQVGVSVPCARQVREHDRFLPLGDPQHQGREAVPRQGAEGVEGMGTPEVVNTDKAPTYAAAIAELKAFAIQGGIVGEARIVERAFGVGPCVLTEAMTLLHDRLASAET